MPPAPERGRREGASPDDDQGGRHHGHDHLAGRDAVAEPAGEPGGVARCRQQPAARRPARPGNRRDGDERGGRDRGPRSEQAGERGDLRAEDEDRARSTPPDPMAGSLRARSAAAGSGAISASAVSASPSRCRPPVDDGQRWPTPRSRRGPARRPADRAAPAGWRPRRPMPQPRPRRNAAAPPAVRSRDARPDREPRQQPDGARAARRSTITSPRRQPHERRVDPEDRPDPGRRRASSAGGPSATTRPSSGRRRGGRSGRPGPRSWSTATTVVPSRPLSSTSSCMTSTWWRMSRWAVGSSRTRIGAAWATATAMNTSCRSPIDSSRTSRPRRAAMPTRSMARVDGVEVGSAKPGQRRLVRQPAERDDLLDRHRERQRRPARGRPRSSGRRLAVDRAQDRLAAQPDRPGPRLRATPVSARSSVDLPAPLGPTRATRSPPRTASDATVEDGRAP